MDEDVKVGQAVVHAVHDAGWCIYRIETANSAEPLPETDTTSLFETIGRAAWTALKGNTPAPECAITDCQNPMYAYVQWSGKHEHRSAFLCRQHNDELWEKLQPLVTTNLASFTISSAADAAQTTNRKD